MKRILAILIILCLLAGQAWGATYYVDATDGNDSRAGTSESDAWKTVAKINSSSFSSGDSILFRKGDVWREQLTVPSSGESGSVITFGSYGAGDSPALAWDMNLFDRASGSGNAGFETLASGSVDDGNPADFTMWTEAPGSGGWIHAVSDSYTGNIAARLYRNTATTYLRFTTASLRPSTTYYMDIHGKLESESAEGLRVRIYDTATATNLQNDGTWSDTTTYLTWPSMSTTLWDTKSTTFQTTSKCTTLRIDIAATVNSTTVTIDDVYLGEGTSRLPGSDSHHITSQYYGILIDSKNYVTIDGLNVIGARGANYSYGQVGGITITGTSDHVAVNNCTTSYSVGTGINAASTTSNVSINEVVAHDNGNTGIYNSAQIGSITECESYKNATLSSDTTDGGGIGSYQGSNITISGNTVYGNGNETIDCDFEISCVAATGSVVIARNNVYDCKHGCIQIAQGGSDSVIYSNILQGFDNATVAGSSPGKHSAIRIGSTTGINPITGVGVYGNTIANGGTAHGYYAMSFIGSASNTPTDFIVRNNIITHANAILVESDTSTTNAVFSNNLYSGSEKWDWKGDEVSTLAAWQSATSQDTQSISADPLFLSSTDFHLQPTSPALWKRATLGAPYDTDFDGLYFGHRGAPIGAYSQGNPRSRNTGTVRNGS